MKVATVRMSIHPHPEPMEIVVNGVHLGQYVAAVRVMLNNDRMPIVQLDLQADVVLEGDAAMVIQSLLPEVPPPLTHEWPPSILECDNDVCAVCRQVRRVAAPVCPGPLKR